MAIVFGIALLAALYLLGSHYFDFALLDAHEHARAPRWLVRGYACLLVVLTLMASRATDLDIEVASNALMVATGLLFGPALAPPFRPNPIRHPTWGERVKMSLQGLASGFALKKACAFIVFGAALLVGTEWWIFLSFGIAAMMLVAKSSLLVYTRDQEATGAERLPSGGWAIVCFVLLVALVPYTLSAETPFEPASWAGFVGLGLGALLPDLIG